MLMRFHSEGYLVLRETSQQDTHIMSTMRYVIIRLLFSKRNSLYQKKVLEVDVLRVMVLALNGA